MGAGLPIWHNLAVCGRYRLSRRKQIVEEYFDRVSEEPDWTPEALLVRDGADRNASDGSSVCDWRERLLAEAWRKARHASVRNQ